MPGVPVLLAQRCDLLPCIVFAVRIKNRGYEAGLLLNNSPDTFAFNSQKLFNN